MVSDFAKMPEAGFLVAYLELGTGSYVIQVAVASFLGLFFSSKVLWQKLKKFFSRRKATEDSG